MHLGQVWLIKPYEKDVSGNQGTAELLYDLGPKARDTTAIYTDLTNDGKYLYLSITTGNHVAALDISDLKNVKRLDNPDEDQPIVGPHYVVRINLQVSFLPLRLMKVSGRCSASRPTRSTLSSRATSFKREASVSSTPLPTSRPITSTSARTVPSFVVFLLL